MRDPVAGRQAIHGNKRVRQWHIRIDVYYGATHRGRRPERDAEVYPQRPTRK
jgi:hypothetical protein